MAYDAHHTHSTEPTILGRPLYTTRTTCRACGGGLDPVLRLGDLHLSDFPLPDEPDPPTAPLDLVVCQACELVQLRHTVDPDLLYSRYWYQSGINETMRAELADVVQAAQGIVGSVQKNRSVVVDIGANDGTLLSLYPTGKGSPLRIAFEPAGNVQDRLHQHAQVVFQECFPSPASKGIPDRSVTILTSIAMFYDLEDPQAFVQEVDRVLAEGGVWIVQMQDLGQMIGATAFDNICFEHLCYYSTRTFANLLAAYDLRVTRVERRAINGGSLRFTIQRTSQAQTGCVFSDTADIEPVSWSAIERFASRAVRYKTMLTGMIARWQESAQAIDLYGASTKANTLLQWCGLDRTKIRCAVERSPEKVGRVTPGTRIPIVSEEAWRADPERANTTLVGIWSFRDAILEREADYIRQGGALIFPLPQVEVVYGKRPTEAHR